MIAWSESVASLLGGPFWFAGCVLLGGGVLVARLARTPSFCVRISELAVFGMALWLAFALVPMPRLTQAGTQPVEGPEIAVVQLEGALLPSERASEPAVAAAAAPGAAPGALRNAAGEAAGDAAAAATSWLPELADVWLLAAGLSLACLLVGAFLLRRLLTRSVVADASVQRLARSIGGRLGLTKPIDVRVHDRLRAPFCCKLRTVVLPRELLGDRDALRAVLAHELAHIVARDPLRRAAFAVLTPLFVLHPAWWLLRRMSLHASEEAADARAAMALGRVASQYARPLIELSARLGQSGVAPLHPSIVGVLGQPDSFTRRMTMLLTRDPAQAVRSLNRRQGFLATASTLLALALSVGTWGTPAVAQGGGQGAARPPMDRTIRPDFQDCSFRDALLVVSKKSGLRIAIDADVAERKIRIERLSLGEMPVRRLLDTLAVAHDLRWQMENGRVVFRPAKGNTPAIDRAFQEEVARRAMEYSLDSTRSRYVKSWWDRVTPHSADPSGSDPVKARPGERQRAVGKELEEARKKYQRGELQAALQLCERALRKAPGDRDVWQLRGGILRALGDEQGAKGSFRKAREYAPPGDARDPTRKKRDTLRDAYLDSAMRVYRDAGKSSDAREKFERGELQSALQLSEQALQLDPSDVKSLVLRAEILRSMGDADGAEQAMQRVRRLLPGSYYRTQKRTLQDTDPEAYKKLMHDRYIDSQRRAYDRDFDESVEKVLPDALRKASERSRQAKDDDPLRKELEKRYPDFPAQYREYLMQYYRKLGRMPGQGDSGKAGKQVAPTVVHPIPKNLDELLVPAGVDESVRRYFRIPGAGKQEAARDDAKPLPGETPAETQTEPQTEPQTELSTGRAGLLEALKRRGR